MKHKLIIWIFLCVIFLMCLFTCWIMKQAFGAERSAEKTIILNFDDGPKPAVLKELLPLLKKYNVQANFFVEGDMIPANQKLIKEMHDVGHGIENHSWGHENFKKLFREKGAEAIRNSVLKTEAAIFNATGRKPIFFRPPFWEINGEIEKIIVAEGYRVMKIDNSDINTMDYEDSSKNRPPEALINRTKSQITSREKRNIYTHILVFHELTITVEALKTFIPYLQSQGYKFARLDAMFPK